MQVERQPSAAVQGERFRRTAARVYAQTVVAHVRRATVGRVALENTHPFCHGRWSFVHNGTLPGFDHLRPRMLAWMTPEHRAAIHGDTDSEHIFHLLLSLQERHPLQPLLETLRTCLQQLVTWCRESDPAARLGLNVVLTDGEQLVGARWGRSLHYVERSGVQDCEVCGFPHVRHDPQHTYRAVILASESISHESWCAVPDRSVYAVTRALALQIEPLLQESLAGPI